jgi:hypothetical protein
MRHSNVTAGAAALVLLLTYGVQNARAATIMIAATVSDRGLDAFPWDGVGATVFGNPSVVQITTPPIGTLLGSEERTGVEFPLAAIPIGCIIDSVSLSLSPVGQVLNIGLGAGEASEVHGYAGDGVIQVADLMDSIVVGSIVGPTANGSVIVVLSPNWLQTLVGSATPFAGLMFRGVPGAIVVAYNFDSAFGGVPLAERPTLIIEHHGSQVIPEPPTVILSLTGFALAAFRRTRSLCVPFIRLRRDRQTGK